MFTDIVGYTSLMGSDEDRAFQLLRKNRNIQRPLIRKYRGEWLKEMGDGVLASFYTASDAVRCAGEIQRASKKEGINLRIGIHEGEVVFAGGDVLGDGVNIASRLEEMAASGCIYISGAVYRDIKNKTGINAVFVGEESFKNVDEPIRVYKVSCRETEPLLPEDRRFTVSRWPWRYGAAGMLVLLAGILIWRVWPANSGITAKRAVTSVTDHSIAVLPFLYLSEDPDKKYLAEGVADAITSHLARISELRVTARTSVERYRNHSMDVRDIGKELSVGYLLEGSFQMHGNEVRLIAQLINAKDGSHVWSNDYDREWSDIFKVQSEVAQSIAGAIQVAIAPHEWEVIEARPTMDLMAYDYYLKGNEYLGRSYLESDFRFAMQMYEKSVGLDSNFVLAWVGLAKGSRMLYWFYHDRSDVNLSMAKRYLDRALSLSPRLKEVKLEEACYWFHCRLDYERSLGVLEKLKTEYPNDDLIYAVIGYVYRRMGELQTSLENIQHAIQLNPAAWEYWYNIAYTKGTLRDYSGAEECFLRAIDLNPSNPLGYAALLNFYKITGQLARAERYLLGHEKYVSSQDLKFFRSKLAFFEGKNEEALQIAGSLSDDAFDTQSSYFTKHTVLGLIYHAIADDDLAARHFSMEKELLLQKINKSENDQRLYRSLGIAYAGLGMKDHALEAGKKALEMLDYSKDRFGSYYPEMDMLQILVMVGQYEDALQRLDTVIRRYGYLTGDLLLLDPLWDPLRNHEKFKEIVSNPAYRVRLSTD